MLPTRRFRAIALLTAAAVLASTIAVPSAAQSRLPALGDPVLADFSVADERRLGEQIMREIRRDADYLDDPLLLEYLQSIWQPLVAAARQHGDIGIEIDQRFAWEAFLVRDRSVNAFALPGGRVGVHLGLIALTSSRDELASVLAHELTHVTQRHVARGIATGKRQSLIGVAAMIVGVLVASRSNSRDAANAVITGGQAASIQGQLNFSRDMEREADRIGIGLMADAGFATGGMATMFEKLDQSSRLNDSGNFPYLRSHPLTAQRIGEARSRLGVGAAPQRAARDLEHLMAQARARVLMDPRAAALRRWQTPPGDAGQLAGVSNDDPLAAACASALASTLLRDWTRADSALQSAVRLLRSPAAAEPRAQRALALLEAESYLARGDAASAAAALAPFEGHATGADAGRPVLLLAAQVALASSNAPASVLRRRAEALETLVATHADDATAWSELSRLWLRLAQPLRAARADAEARAAIGDLDGAAERLRAGQQRARTGPSGDFIEASVIDARLRDIEVARRRLAAETRGGGG